MIIEHYLPPLDIALSLEPEEIAIPLLKYLISQNDASRGTLHLHNFIIGPDVRDYAKDKYDQIATLLTEAWIWLEHELMLAPSPGHDKVWMYVTKRGKILADSGDINKYRKGNIIPPDALDPVLANKVLPIFIRGDYDTAVFQAFKEVEIRVRSAASLPPDLLGVDLMRKAFHFESGPLTEKDRVKGETEAVGHLFAGAIGLFKNPSSHREVNWDSAQECAELIYLANHLLRIVDRQSKNAR